MLALSYRPGVLQGYSSSDQGGGKPKAGRGRTVFGLHFQDRCRSLRRQTDDFSGLVGNSPAGLHSFQRQQGGQRTVRTDPATGRKEPKASRIRGPRGNRRRGQIAGNNNLGTSLRGKEAPPLPRALP